VWCQARFVGRWRNGAAARWAGPSVGHVFYCHTQQSQTRHFQVKLWCNETKGGLFSLAACSLPACQSLLAWIRLLLTLVGALISLPEGSELSLWTSSIQRCCICHRVKKKKVVFLSVRMQKLPKIIFCIVCCGICCSSLFMASVWEDPMLWSKLNFPRNMLI